MGRTYGDTPEQTDPYDAHVQAELAKARAAYNRLQWRMIAARAQWEAYERGVMQVPPPPADAYALLVGFRLGLEFARDHGLAPKRTIDPSTEAERAARRARLAHPPADLEPTVGAFEVPFE